MTLGGMKKKLEEEKNGREEEKKKVEQEKQLAEEERRLREESEKRAEEEKRKREEEKRMKEEEKKRADKLEAELRALQAKQKEADDRRYTPATSLQNLPYYVTNGDEVTRSGNKLSGSKSTNQSSIIGPELKSVCYHPLLFITQVHLHYREYIECIPSSSTYID